MDDKKLSMSALWLLELLQPHADLEKHYEATLKVSVFGSSDSSHYEEATPSHKWTVEILVPLLLHDPILTRSLCYVHYSVLALIAKSIKLNPFLSASYANTRLICYRSRLSKQTQLTSAALHPAQASPHASHTLSTPMRRSWHCAAPRARSQTWQEGLS
jgi:hypothetical protein